MRYFASFAFILFVSCALAQQPDSTSPSAAPTPTPAATEATPVTPAATDQTPAAAAEPTTTAPTPAATDQTPAGADAPAQPSADQSIQSPKPTEAPAQSGVPSATNPSGAQLGEPIPESKRQPKRILGIMPNYRAVSAGAIPPPPTARQAFKVATQNSFDYSSFVFVGVTSALAEATDAHPQLGKGMAGFGRYYWRGFLDKTDGNYLVIFALPTIFHEDERYYAKGEGGFLKRAAYSSSRVLITPNYHGHNTFNFSEVVGRGIAQGISREYYPSSDRTMGALAVRYGYAVGRDALTNVFREFWPDIATHVLRRHP